jgi:hypothetical protein
MKKLTPALLVAAVAALLCAVTASAGLPKPKDTDAIKVPESIAGVSLKLSIKKANKAWGRRGDCDLRGFQTCTYEGRNPRVGSASIEAAVRGNVSSFGIFAGRAGDGGYFYKGRLLGFETKEGIGLGDKGSKVARAYPQAIKTANRTGYIVEGEGRAYMTFQTLDDKRVTAITVVDGKHQG